MEVKIGTHIRRTIGGIRLVGTVTQINGSTCWIRWEVPDDTVYHVLDVASWQ